MSNIIKTTDQNNKLTLPNKLGPRKVGLASRVDAAREEGNLASEVLNFSNVPNRIVLCVDDSGSMSAFMNERRRIEVAKEACQAFLSVCNPADTVLGMYTISTNKQTKLTFDYAPILIAIKDLKDSGGTPLYGTLNSVLKNENVTRVVCISDGAPTDGKRYREWDGPEDEKIVDPRDITLNAFVSKGVIIDAVFIGTENDTNGIEEMKYIANTTKGQFIHFKNANDFAAKFKYLAPAFYGLLSSGEIKL